MQEIIDVNIKSGVLTAPEAKIKLECSQIVQQNNNNLVLVVRRLIKFATKNTGAYETIGLILTYLNKLSMNKIKALLEQHTLEEGFQHINKKLVDFLSAPESVLPEMIHYEH